MCYAIPGRLVEINKDTNKAGDIGVVDYFGEKRNVLIDVDDVSVGDYVYAQGGVLIKKISEEEALEVLGFWKERFFELKKRDKELARVNDLEVSGKDMSGNVLEILQKVNLKQVITKEDMRVLLKVQEENEIRLVYETANNVRQKDHDNACCVHGIIEFSNYCRNDCHYCGIRKSSDVERYRISEEEIIEVARTAVEKLGFKAVVLQSGEDEWYTEEKLVRIVKEIRELGVLVFVSVGVRPKETYARLYDSGARAVLLRFETSNKELFQKLRPGTNFEERIELIKYLKEIGYLIATGFLIGLPGEREDDLINNILLTKELNADMYSFGPLVPAGGTPLASLDLVDKNRVLKTIALSRFVDRRSKILVTTALETLGESAKKDGLMAGANSLMINVTPADYRNLYSLYPNRPDKDKEIKKIIDETLDLLYSIGRAPTDIGL